MTSTRDDLTFFCLTFFGLALLAPNPPAKQHDVKVVLVTGLCVASSRRVETIAATDVMVMVRRV